MLGRRLRPERLPLHALGGVEGHLPAQRPREAPVEVALLAGDHLAVRQGEADRWRRCSGARCLDVRGPAVEQLKLARQD